VTCSGLDIAGNVRLTGITVNVEPFIPPLTITTASLPAGTIASPYTATLQASGGTGSDTWSLRADTLPPGLTLNAAGVISGTPTTGGTYTFTVQATDIEGLTAQKQFTVQVAVSVAGLCQLTQADVESSAKFAKLSAKDQKALDQTIQVICNGITAISPKLTAKQKTAAIAAYKASVGLLQTQGWLTAAQASTLKADADQL
jgi:hypothetical protein